MSVDPRSAGSRCAEHPARPAADRCARCGRPRCAADQTRYATAGCAVCTIRAPHRAQAGQLEVAVRAGLAVTPVAMVGGWIATQYVGDHVFSVVVPGLVGLAAGWAGQAATPVVASLRWRLMVAAICVAGGVLGTALGFRLVPGDRQSVLHPLGVVAAPYGCAVVAAVAWSLAVAPTTGRRHVAPDG